MRVVPVDAPRRENPFGESVFARASDVIHNFVATIFHDRFADSRSDCIKHFIPAYTFPLAFAPLACPLERIKDAIGIGNLVQRRRAFGAVAPSAPRILRIAFELLNLVRVFVDVSEQPARRLTVKARGRYKLIMSLFAPGPCLRIQLSPITPTLFWWECREMNARRAGIKGFVVFFGSAHLLTHLTRFDTARTVRACSMTWLSFSQD